MKTIFTVAAAFALSFAAIAPASAMEAKTTITTMQSVSYADLDLNDRADARIMLRRINHAARDLCGDRLGNVSISERYAVRACMRETTRNAVTELDHPMLTAVHEGRSTPAMMMAQR